MRRKFCCSRCRQNLGAECFAKGTSRKEGLDAYCRVCRAIVSAEYREKNRERLRAYQHDYSRRRMSRAIAAMSKGEQS